MSNDNAPPAPPPAPEAKPKVISLRGGDFPQPGEPNTQVVDALEAALVEAKAGRLVGVAILENDPNGLVSGDWYGFWRKISLIGQCEILKAAVLAALDEECNPPGPEKDRFA